MPAGHSDGGLYGRLRADSFDAGITADFLSGDGRFQHSHLSHLFLEKYEPAEDDIDRDVLLSGSRLYAENGSLAGFTDCYEDCRKALS